MFEVCGRTYKLGFEIADLHSLFKDRGLEDLGCLRVVLGCKDIFGFLDTEFTVELEFELMLGGFNHVVFYKVEGLANF